MRFSASLSTYQPSPSPSLPLSPGPCADTLLCGLDGLAVRAVGGVETLLDVGDGLAGLAALALDEGEARHRILVQDRVERLAHLALHVRKHVPAGARRATPLSRRGAHDRGKELTTHGGAMHGDAQGVRAARNGSHLRTTDSICFGVKRPLKVSFPSGSSEQATPNSALKYDMTCSMVRWIFLQMSLKLTNTVFFDPSLATCPKTQPSAGCCCAQSGLAARQPHPGPNSLFQFSLCTSCPRPCPLGSG